MNLRKVAQVILDQRKLSLNVMTGKMMEDLTPEGYQEALRLGWLTPDMETGGLRISDHLENVELMKSIVEAEPRVGEAVQVKDGGKTYLGVVQTRTPDGKFKITFGGDAKPQTERDYDVAELSVEPTASTPAHVGTPTAPAPVERKSPIGTTGSVTPAMR